MDATEFVRRYVTGSRLFYGAKLDEVNLSDINLNGAILHSASLSGANLDRANLMGANLTNANLCKTDLSGATLTGANLTSATLSGANLTGATLTSATLTGTNLSGANLTGANLTGAFLEFANFKNSLIDSSTTLDSKWYRVWQIVNQIVEFRDLSEIDLSYANLRDAFFGCVNLSETNLAKADLSNAELTAAMLVGSNLSEAKLSGAKLAVANLSKANLFKAQLDGAIIRGADLKGANLSKALLVEASLYSANLSEADLSFADLTFAFLAKAKLLNANLYKANLSQSNLFSADLRGANLKNTNLENSNLAQINFLDSIHLNTAALKGTILSRAKNPEIHNDINILNLRIVGNGFLQVDLRPPWQESSNQLVINREGSRTVLLEALEKTEERLIIVCPWLSPYACNLELLYKFKKKLKQGKFVNIGWGCLSDIKETEPKSISRADLIRATQKSPWKYEALPALEELEREFPGQFTLKLLGTHEKILICDRSFAVVSSHNMLTSNDKSKEREIGLRTNDPQIIAALIELFENAKDLDLKANIC